MDNNIELLAPAGSYDTMKAAILAGADAVYIGGRLFGARAYADNPDNDMLLEAVDYVHLRNKKLYLTVNTLLKDDEIEDRLYDYIRPLYLNGLDAVIVQDLGVMQFMQENFPKLPIHASTQMTITGEFGAAFLNEQKNVTRVVTARELSLEEIKEIRSKCTLEIESFIHGALCYSYSGQCLFSSIAGGRSGNRGRCAQPCRMEYKASNGKNGYFISPKDLCTVNILPDIIESGVTSLKIEGRMKKAEYTAGVVSVYRKYLDLYLSKGREKYNVSGQDMNMLLDLFNRGGFTEGYYKKHNGRDMIFISGRDSEEKGRNEELFAKVRRDYIECPQEKIYITGEAYIYAGQPAKIVMRRGNAEEICVLGTVVQAAQNQPMTEEKIMKQLKKLGGTEFEWDTSKAPLSVFTDGKSFISVTELNDLRRNAVVSLKEEILKKYRREPVCRKSCECTECDRKCGKENSISGYQIYAYVEDISVLERLAAEFAEYSGFYIDMVSFSDEDIFKGIQICKDAGKKVYVAMPHIFRKSVQEYFDKLYDGLQAAKPDGFLARNLDGLRYLNERGNKLPVLRDYNMYAYNKRARDFLDKYADKKHVLPFELNFKELCALGAENGILTVYGRIPMMVSAQCSFKTMTGACHNAVDTGTGRDAFKRAAQDAVFITDRMNNVFPIKTYCRLCYNKIYNCRPLSLLTVKKETDRLSPLGIKLDFTTETADEAVKISEKFINVFVKGNDERELSDFTRGHFKRGIG